MDHVSAGEIIVTLVPLIISAIVAIVTDKSNRELRDQLSRAMTRIAVLEQLIEDHGIPVPTPLVDRTTGLNPR
jgi:hypothetical protein